MLTFHITRPESLLANMVRTLLLESCPGAAVDPETDALAEDWGGIRVTAAGTGRWFCVFPSNQRPRDLSVALSAGASAVLTLDAGHRDFVRALDAATVGDAAFVPIEVLRWMASASVAERPHRGEDMKARLTAREREVLQLVASGHSNAEIAEALTISRNTVRCHIHALSVKLEATSRIRMVRNAAALGFQEAEGATVGAALHSGRSA